MEQHEEAKSRLQRLVGTTMEALCVSGWYGLEFSSGLTLTMWSPAVRLPAGVAGDVQFGPYWTGERLEVGDLVVKLSTCLRECVSAVAIHADGTLVLSFANETELVCRVGDPEVDWYWSIAEGWQSPHLGFWVACFDVGVVEVHRP